ncbi:hypothetical protein AAY473_030008 [Plecturocebus cupreus]
MRWPRSVLAVLTTSCWSRPLGCEAAVPSCFHQPRSRGSIRWLRSSSLRSRAAPSSGEVRLLQCLLPVLERCLGWELENFVRFVDSASWRVPFQAKKDMSSSSGKSIQKAGWSEASTLCPAQGAIHNQAAFHQCGGCREAHTDSRFTQGNFT